MDDKERDSLLARIAALEMRVLALEARLYGPQPCYGPTGPYRQIPWQQPIIPPGPIYTTGNAVGTVRYAG